VKKQILYFKMSFPAVNRGKPVDMYYRGGDEAVLPCNRPSSSDSCSAVDWFHKRNENINIQQEVHRGIVQSSPRSARMSLDRNCSLIINNINADDAGWYRCSYNTDVYLNLLIISSSPPAADPTKNGKITLICSLVRFRGFSSCPVKSLLWLDETGSELTGEGDGYKSGGRSGCVSFLPVNLQSSRRFTCQFVGGNKVKVCTELHHIHDGSLKSFILT
uniref:Ig-like domain-containing protein n=1 Tax=Poecilia formosa TaxID=48698 RepID=A0A087YB58_POEFO